MPADRSVDPYAVSLLRQPLKQWGRSQPFVDDRLLSLPGPYFRHAIGTFNTCSRGPTHRFFTDTSGGYNLGGVGFPYHTPQPSQLIVLHFPPTCPVRSQVIQSQLKPLVKCGMQHLSPTRGLSTTQCLPKSISTPSND
jgi:hypothetical protein